MFRLLITTTVLALFAENSLAEEKINPLTIPVQESDEFEYYTEGTYLLDVGLAFGTPSALVVGIGVGVSTGIAIKKGRFRFGSRATIVSAKENTLKWEVRHTDYKMRGFGALVHEVGRGSFGFRLSGGATLVHETRERHQGKRLGFTGSALSTSAFTIGPAADIEAIVAVHVSGAWLFSLSGGPSLAYLDKGLQTSWSSTIGGAWLF